MIEIKDLTHRFGKQLLFQNVNLGLDRSHRYGLIGANGAGKSTFLKILSGEVEHTSGEIAVDSGLKIGVLGQDQFAFEDFTLKLLNIPFFKVSRPYIPKSTEIVYTPHVRITLRSIGAT